MSFIVETAKKQKVKLKLGLFGPSGSGKTYSALRLAYGMTGDRSKICVIDTENSSASLYSDLGDYKVINFLPPFSPDRYIEAIEAAIKSGAEVVIIDSISHERSGKGGILDIKEQMTGNDFTKRAKLTPLHNKFREAILQSPVHVIVTGRTKEEYNMVQDANGKLKVEKAGTNIVQREGVEYELTLAFTLDIKHNATASKDRTKLFMDKVPFVITEETGKQLLERCNSGADAQPTIQMVANDPNKTMFDKLLAHYGLEFHKESCQKIFDTLLKDPNKAQEYIEKVKSSDKFGADVDAVVNFINEVANYAISR